MPPQVKSAIGNLRNSKPSVLTDGGGYDCLQAGEQGQLLLSVAIAMPLVVDAVNYGVLMCRIDPHLGKAGIESTSTGAQRKAVHMTAQAGASGQA